MKLSRLVQTFCLQAQFDKPHVISITTIQYIRHEQPTHYYVIVVGYLKNLQTSSRTMEKNISIQCLICNK